jgi:hypothetical protein
VPNSAQHYTVSSGRTAAAAAGTAKVAVALATGASVKNVIFGIDITFDSTATGAGAISALVELVRTTAASSGGAVATPVSWLKSDIASLTTARINDTTDGTGPTVIKSWLVPVLSGVLQQLPLGREISMNVSDFLELRITLLTGATACDYNANLDFEE